GAVGGLRGDVPVGVQGLHDAAGVLGALGGQQPAVRERHGDPVVRRLGRGLPEHVQLAVAEAGRVDHGDLRGAVGEDRGAVGVGHDVPGLRRVNGEGGECGILYVVVEVVAVALGDQAGVVHG